MHKQVWANSPAFSRITLALACVAIVGVSLTGCTGGDEVVVGTQITSLTATPATVDEGSTSVVEGLVSQNGTPVNNIVVTFAVTPSSAGYFTPAFDTSDANGLVAAIFTATTSGTATLGATVEGGVAVTTPVTVQQAASSGSGNVTMSLSNSLLLANGSSSSIVTVTVRDALSNAAPDGTIIRLTAGEKFVDVDGNGYWSAGVDSLVFDANGNSSWDAIGVIPATAIVAGGAGSVAVTYTSGTVASTVYIKASVDDGAFTGDIETSIQLTPDAAVNSIFLDSDSIHLAVKQTGGYETTTLRAWCYDLNGNSVPEGLSVSFVITDGPGGGENIANLGYGPFTGITNSQGLVTAPISSGTISGTVRIRAYADTVLSNSTQLVIDAGPPVEIAVGADTCNIRLWRTVNGEVKIVAVVRDVYHNPVTDSTAVYFTVDEGQVMAHQVSTRDHKGVASSLWLSGYDGTAHDGIVWVYAETSGGTVRDSTAFFNSDYIATMVPVGWPTSLNVDGEDKADFTINLFDFNGNPVINFLEVDHQERFLFITLERSKNQCGGSFVAGEVQRVGPLNRDYSITGGVDDGIGAIDNVLFFAENGSVNVVCTLTTGFSYSKNSSFDELSLSINGGQTTPFNATIKDRFGNPLGDHTLAASASAGTITSGTQTTNLYGEAYGFQFTAPTDTTISKVILSITDTDPRGNGMIITRDVSIVH